MEESFIDIKVEFNPIICLKDVSVSLERLSAATILQYTGTSIMNTGSQSNVKGAIVSAKDIPTADIKNIDLGIIVKVEKDTGLSEYDASSETQDEAILPIVKQETYIKEELILSMSECLDDEGDNEFVSLKRKYDDFDDQLVPNVSKKYKMEHY